MELEFKNVTGTGRGFRLRNISFSVPNGFITGLVGKNGAGKTTLFHYIMDEDAKYEGSILVDEKPLQEHYKESMYHIGFISEEQHFFKEKTALENIHFFSVFYPVFESNVFLDRMKQMELSIHKTVGKMSRGEFLKFQLAFALAHETKLFLLDEVTAGMDPIFRKEFFHMLHEVIAMEDTAILMSTHIEEELHTHMDYVVRMENGSLLSFEEVEETLWNK